MRTPAGKECPHYYQDFHRGHSTQKCRLVKENQESLQWQPSDCFRCSIPDILSANASPVLRLDLTISPIFFGIGRRLEITAYCDKHEVTIDDPYVGCSQCHAERPGIEAFIRALEDSDD